ncbi:gag/pol protein [Cucumis melo var. makuwa]|uniref:Gag/pol protein n=1 Tax=Cucumis melo var. makuwa TaxID=1194695 RepID=A0A5D3D345_CUCMM|nr:gag/pol protein [Cucumis melo var. makuwa]TYK17854.1 gag/pol protein [Cucumis melo var. makuwa]
MTIHPTISSIGLHREILIMRLLVCPRATYPSEGCIIRFGTPRTPYLDRASWISFHIVFPLYILASMSNVLAKKHESLVTAKEKMDSLKGMFGQPEWSLRHEAIKYIYIKRMKEGTSVREHVLDMMMHFNIAEVNGGAIDEANQRFQNLIKGKGKEVEANVATTKRKFERGSSSKPKVGPSKPNRKIEKKGKEKTSKQKKGKKTAKKGKCYHCGEDGHWLRNCLKYIAQKKAEKETQGKFDLLVLETCLVENENSTWILDSGAINHICFSFQENSSWKKLSEGKITLKVGTREMSSAKAVGDLKIGRLVKSGLLSQLEDNSLPPCDSCLEGKMTKRSFTGKGLRTKTPLELVHSDLCGPMNVKAKGGYEYFISLIDDYSRYGHVYLIQNKSDSFKKFKKYKAEVENESDRPSSSTKVVDKTRNIGQTHPSQELGEPRCSGRVVRQPNRYLGLSEAQIVIPNDGIEDPLTYKRAINDVDYKKWLATYGIHLSKEQCSKTPQEVEGMSNIPYASVVGSLMYAMLCTRPDICYSVGMVSRYQSNPGCDHWTVVKNILKYLRRTKDYMLVYGSKNLILTRYTDFVFQSDKDARKSTSKSVFTLNRGAILQIHENLEVINEGNTLNESTILSGKSYIKQNMADPFTKALTAKVFESHLHGLGLRCL